MHHRRRRVAAAALLVFAAVSAPPASAQSTQLRDVRLNFAPPVGWTALAGGRPGVWNWRLSEGSAVHSIVLTLTRESRPAATYGPESAQARTHEAGVTLLESGPATVCGDVPAYTFAYRSERSPGHPTIVRHVLVDVGSLLGDVSYARPAEAAERADARDALTTMCEQQFYVPRVPASWRGAHTSVGQSTIDMFSAASGGAKLIARVAPAPAGTPPRALAPAELGAGAAMIDENDETCGTTHVRRAHYRSKSGADTLLIETLSGYRHGGSYIYAYSRPEATPLDPAAERALASFCDESAALATPVPSAH